MLKRLAAICFALTFVTPQAVHTLQGRVLLPSGAPPSNSVKVTLTYSGRRMYETFTDLSGRFSFTGLTRGTYQLVAEGDGQSFETTITDAEVTGFGSAPQTFTQNVQLRLKPGKEVLPAGVVSAKELEGDVPARARKAYEKGLKRAADDKAEQALKFFEEAISIYPEYYSAHVAAGEQYVKLQQYAQAEVFYQKAIEMNANRAAAHIGIGMMLIRQKRYGDAISPLRRGAELDKQTATPLLFLGLAEMLTGDFQSAEANLQKAYQMSKPPIAHIYLANLYELKGEPARAIEHLQLFLKENPNIPQARQTEIRQVIEKLRKQQKNVDK